MITEDKFHDLTSSIRCKRAVREALKDILVHGDKWAESCKKHGVAESSISRALKRISCSCPYCGK